MQNGTIAAISTPPGKGGVAVIRISGEDAAHIACRVFRPRGKVSPTDNPRLQIYGDILYRGEIIDDGLITFFPAPHSFTGEDTVEIACHGGILITKTVLESCFIEGAVPAEAGEFTKRAFVSGKLSLTETEAISNLLEAKSASQIMLARDVSRSRLTIEIEAISREITELLSSIWARIDYPDEDLGEISRDDILSVCSKIGKKIDSLMDTYKTGKAVCEGISATIIGSPNVGKSTLYNLLLGEDAAIVTDIPGTTTDVLSKDIPIGKVMLKLSDTAGLRGEGAGKIEAIGISRSLEKMRSSELVIMLLDSSRDISEEEKGIIEELASLASQKIIVLTKSELCDKDRLKEKTELISSLGFKRIIPISAKADPAEAIKTVSDTVNELFTDGSLAIGSDAIVFSARQNASLARAQEHINAAILAYKSGLAEDAASSELELALGAISELSGKAVSEMVIADIFSRFCVGK